MLRPKLSVISLTIGEVKEHECRRRFQRYLRVEDTKCRSFETDIARREVPIRVDFPMMSPAQQSPIDDDGRTQAHITSSQATSLTSIVRGQSPIGQRHEDVVPLSVEARRGRDLPGLAGLEGHTAAEREQFWPPPDPGVAGMPRPAEPPRHPARSRWERAMQKARFDTAVGVDALMLKFERGLNLDDDPTDSEGGDKQFPDIQNPRTVEIQERNIPDPRSSRRVGHT